MKKGFGMSFVGHRFPLARFIIIPKAEFIRSVVV
jgi:hypothetical protein